MMTDPTLDVIALIDEDIIFRRIAKEWHELSNEALEKVSKKLEEKYGYEVGWFGSDGVWEITPTNALQNEIAKIRAKKLYEKTKMQSSPGTTQQDL